MKRFLILVFCSAMLWPMTVAAQTQSEASAYQQFRSAPSVIGGEAFLNEYPYGKYADKVSDEMCRMLSDGLNAYSVEEDYARALKYARSTQMSRYAETKIAAAKKARKKFEANPSKYMAAGSGSTKTRRSSSGGIFSLGASFLMDFSDKTLGLGGLVNLRLGNSNNILNGIVGAKYMSVSLEKYSDEAIAYKQFAVPVTLRFNILRMNALSASLYLGAGASYNCNLSVKYEDSDGDKVKIDKSMINKNTYSGLAQIGIGGGRIDCNFYVQYDLKPVVVDTKKQCRYGFEIGWYFLRK